LRSRDLGKLLGAHRFIRSIFIIVLIVIFFLIKCASDFEGVVMTQ
jgi:hypothetical protein